MNQDALFKMLLKRPAILRSFFEVFLPVRLCSWSRKAVR